MPVGGFSSSTFARVERLRHPLGRGVSNQNDIGVFLFSWSHPCARGVQSVDALAWGILCLWWWKYFHKADVVRPCVCFGKNFPKQYTYASIVTAEYWPRLNKCVSYVMPR